MSSINPSSINSPDSAPSSPQSHQKAMLDGTIAQITCILCLDPHASSVCNAPWLLGLRQKQAESKAAGGVWQCDGCLIYFKPEDGIQQVCPCGSSLCFNCQTLGKVAPCWCGC